jgi:hypothetical protein
MALAITRHRSVHPDIFRREMGDGRRRDGMGGTSGCCEWGPKPWRGGGCKTGDFLKRVQPHAVSYEITKL